MSERNEPRMATVVEEDETYRETELWQVLDWSLWGNGLGDVLRTAMADAMVSALTEKQREEAETCIKAWHERRGPSVAVGVGTALWELLGMLWLHVDWRYVTRQLTTEQRNLWADAVDTTGDPGSKADRWWADA